MTERQFWNEEIETMAPAALRRLEAKRLKTFVEYIYKASPYYKWVFDQADMAPGDIKKTDDIGDLPLMEKSDLLRAQRDGAFIGLNQCALFEKIVRLSGTESGAGNFLRMAWTQNDIDVQNEMGARALWTMGCRPAHLVVNCTRYGLNANGMMIQQAVETAGATAVAYGDGGVRDLFDLLNGMMRDVILLGTPGYASLLADLAQDEGLGLKAFGLRRGFLIGQGARAMPGDRRELQDQFGMETRDVYHVPELGLYSGECGQGEGLHFGGGGHILVQLIHPSSGQSATWEDGACGEMVYTTLTRQACPLLRLRSGQHVQIFTEPCACGRTSFRFRSLVPGHNHRTD
ncbi:MAG: hypothetical protein AAF530_18845 [Pseudomonadota bacterium]